ncbi:allantoin racemase, partial [Tremellales sp. Uapishka_1]
MSNIIKLLAVNPNSSASITGALRAALEPNTPSGASLDFFNPASGPAGIHDAATAASSCAACMSELGSSVFDYEGILVCCFSDHPLISSLRAYVSANKRHTVVLGIYHAGVAAALLHPGKFGIIATGTGEKTNLILSTAEMLGSRDSTRFVGPLTTGLGVVELQEGDRAKVKKGLRDTTSALVDRGAETIVLGCAGMSGMNGWVEAEGEAKGVRVTVIDGAKMGIGMLLALIR